MTTLKPNQIIQGDVLEVAKGLPSRSVNCIVTSPAYWGLRDYQTGEWEGGDEGCDHKKRDARRDPDRDKRHTDGRNPETQGLVGVQDVIQYSHTCLKCGAIRIDKQLGLEETPEAYVANLVEVFRELRRVLMDDGTLWLNLGDSYANSPKGSIVTNNSTLTGAKAYQANGTPPKLLDKSKLDGIKPKNLVGIPWRVAFALQADGWYLRSDIIWHKPNPMPESVTDRPTKSHEYLFLLTKKPRYWYDQEAIREEANYDGRKDTVMKGADKLKAVPGQSPNSMFVGGAERWPTQTADGEPGRNKRSVWKVATQPYKGAHFATFPPKLIEPCILAGCPGRVCVECGEPWVRIVEKRDGGFADRTFRSPHEVATPGMTNGQGKTTLSKVIEHKTICFTPTCQCCPLPANKIATRPGIVLDPFFGSGTVAEVAIKNKVDWLGIELNREYIELAKDRIHRTQPALFSVSGSPRAKPALTQPTLFDTQGSDE